MEQRLSMITLGVADLETSKQFYEQVVGWASAHGPDGIAFLTSEEWCSPFTRTPT